MTLSIIPVDATGINNIADGLTGFTDETHELQQSTMTTLFISGASEASSGRCAYLLLEDGSRMWVPNSLRCWLVDLSIKTQHYEGFDPAEKLLIRVTASDGTTYVYRCGFNSWTATSSLGVMAQVAQFEAARIGERTREALASAKARCVKLGGRREEAVKAAQARKDEALERAQALRGLIATLVESGQSRRAIAAALNDAGHRTVRGSHWNHRTIVRVIELDTRMWWNARGDRRLTINTRLLARLVFRTMKTSPHSRQVTVLLSAMACCHLPVRRGTTWFETHAQWQDVAFRTTDRLRMSKA